MMFVISEFRCLKFLFQFSFYTSWNVDEEYEARIWDPIDRRRYVGWVGTGVRLQLVLVGYK